ncbi:MAG TPA: tRNA pseudouridine(55) synthase TruB [Tepidisphaeraceae bacterium]|jgi:tRNA pseudouridine55 synthase|nr:tRNA pseudouridine(55) synthase TruB [Tepidisphaeraceae bacterium]
MDATVNGILNVDKPQRLSSAAAVGRVKWLLGKKYKVGHAGTLDPFATGVLLILVGRGTKQCEALMGQPKRYVATIKLGATTPTLDPTSEEIAQPVNEPISRAAVEAALPSFVGNVLQQPPAFSALKLGGRSAYKLARIGEVVELQPRHVRVYSIDLLDYAWPFATVDVHCGRGTYVRALARDIGQHLGVGGYLSALRRTAVGAYRVDQSVPLDALTSGDDVLRQMTAPPRPEGSILLPDPSDSL